MKKQQLAEVKKMDLKAVAAKSKQLRLELQDLVLSKAGGSLTDKQAVTKKRRDLAQTLAVFRQKQLLSELEGETNAK